MQKEFIYYAAETTHKETDIGVLALTNAECFFYGRTEQGSFITLNDCIRGEIS
jgi:hypothetical protein